MTSIGIIIGSTRPGHNGEKVARWVQAIATEHAGETAEFELIDLQDHRLRLLDEPVPAARTPGQHPHTRRFAEHVGSCDAFIFDRRIEHRTPVLPHQLHRLPVCRMALQAGRRRRLRTVDGVSVTGNNRPVSTSRSCRLRDTHVR
ncbi:NADPH-dependent FMN reductase [Nocardia sp. NPDC004123]